MGADEVVKRILVMDDDDMIGEIVIQMLEYFGFEVVHVKDGTDAVSEYKKQRERDRSFDLVIMDLTVPGGMGGEEAVGEILAVDQHAKVLVSSGYANDPVMVNYKDYGFVGVLAKPFDLTAIQKTIEAIL